MASNYVEWYLQLFNRRTGTWIDDDTGLYTVLTQASPVVLTAYKDAQGTALTLPGTMTDGIIRFFLDSATTAVDVTVLSANGQAYFLENVKVSQHRVDVDPEKQSYQLVLPWNGNTACNVSAATGFNLLNGMRVKDVFLHVTTITTATAMHVGVPGTPSGFLVLAPTSVTGYKQGDVNMTATGTVVAGASVFVSTVQTRGTLITDWAAGLTTASVGAAKGFFAKKAYLSTATTAIVYTIMETNSGGTGSGYIYLEFDTVPTAGN